ncbi:MAG TPA: hypothetical protein PKZ53_17740, partial [Acidobacteriota bacterium]|nr:hypothetical protein [Acidobacteriota bacterium]
ILKRIRDKESENLVSPAPLSSYHLSPCHLSVCHAAISSNDPTCILKTRSNLVVDLRLSIFASDGK